MNRGMNIAQWLGLVVLLGLFYILWQVRQLLLLLFGAIVLAVALDTLARIPQRYGFRRGPSLIMTALTVVVVTALLGLIIFPPLAEQFGILFTLVPDGIKQAETLVRDLISRLPFTVELPSLQELISTLTPETSNLINRSFNFFSSSLNVLINLFLVIILTILLVSNPMDYIDAFVRIFPDFYRPRIRYILSRCENSLRNWLSGILITSSLVMVLSGIGLAILGVPLALANAVLAGTFNLIPNIGPTLSVVAPLAVALTVAPWKAGLVLVLYVLIQQLESTVLTPLVMARQVNLLPGLTLIAQVLFATFFGVLGLFLAVPLAAVLQVWIQEVLIKDVLDPWKNPHTIVENITLELEKSLDEKSSDQSLDKPADKPLDKSLDKPVDPDSGILRD